MLHPSRAVSNCTGMEEEGRSDANHQLCVEYRQIASEESLLFRSAHSYPDNVRLQRPYPGLQLPFFRRSHRSKRWRVSSHNLCPRKPSRHFIPQTVSNTVLSSTEEMSAVTKLRSPHHLDHQIGPKDSFHRWKALSMPHPDRGHSIWSNQESFSENRLEHGISLSFHDPVDSR